MYRLAIDYPLHLSKNAKNFIQKLLVKNPKDRMTIEQLKMHPFIAAYCEKK